MSAMEEGEEDITPSSVTDPNNLQESTVSVPAAQRNDIAVTNCQSNIGGLRSRYCALNQLHPRSYTSSMSSTLHRIDENPASNYVRPPNSPLCRHGSLMTLGKQNGNVRNGNFKTGLGKETRRLSLSDIMGSDDGGANSVVQENNRRLSRGRNSGKFCFALESFRTNFRPREFLRGKLGGRSRYRNRLVQKGGYCNISLVNVPKQRRKYFSDIFTTLVDVKWRWCLLVFALSFLITWLVFSVIYYLIALAHGDFVHADDADWEPCIQNGRTYLAILIFSVASQHTIGWGYRYPTEQCPEVLFTICIQSIVGVMIQTLMAGVVFAKLARPKKRAETLIFSKNAVICMQDGNLCFLFRVGDMRKSQLAEAHVRVQMIRNRITDEGELLPFHQGILHKLRDTFDQVGGPLRGRRPPICSEEAGLKPEEAFRCAKMEEVENMGVTPCSTIHRGERNDLSRPLISEIFERKLREAADNTETV